jgi:chemotaxis signal transduction protein
VTDGYRDDVLAVVFESFGVERERVGGGNRAQSVLEAQAVGAGSREYATFFIDGALFAIEAEYALEALPASAISPVSIGGRPERCGILALRQEGAAQDFVWVFDLGHLIRGVPSEVDSSSQVIVVRHGQQSIGLLVSELHAVPEFGVVQITPTPFAGSDAGMLVPQVIRANGGRLLIQAIDVGYLFGLLMDQEPIREQPAMLKMAA